MTSENLKHALKNHHQKIIEYLLPNAKYNGNGEYTIGDALGSPGESMLVNIEKGVFIDNASDDKGSIIDLWMINRAVDFDTAKTEIMDFCGIVDTQTVYKPLIKESPEGWEPFPHLLYPDRYWDHAFPFYNKHGDIVFYKMRKEATGDAKKSFGVRVAYKGDIYTKMPNHLKETSSLPLYGLPDVLKNESLPIVVFEGEKKVDIAKKKLPGFACVSFSDGAQGTHKQDWSPLLDRDVILWPDNDTPGKKAMESVFEILNGMAKSVKFVPIPHDKPTSWDVVDAIKEGIVIASMVESSGEIAKSDKPEVPTLSYADPETLYRIFLGERYPDDGYFVHGGIPYIWSKTHWKQIPIEIIQEEFYTWCFDETDFRQIIDSLAAQKLIDGRATAQGIFDRSRDNLKRHRGKRKLDDVNPFSMINGVNPYWTFPNGALHIHNDGVTWHGREDNTKQFFMNLYPLGCMGFDYNPDKKSAPLFESTIKRVLGENSNPANKRLILESFAYSLLPEKPVPYYFVCHGKEGSGKSSLVEVLRELAGGYYIAKSMREVFSEFGKSSLVGKLIVHDDDINDDYIIPTEIKKLSGDNILTINEKNRPHYQARLNLSPWLIGNKPPKTTGSAGHARRAVVFEFSSTEARDPMHMKKMFGKIAGFEDERPAIMNMVLQALPEFIERGYTFEHTEWTTGVHKAWLKSGNSVASYFSEMADDCPTEKPLYYKRKEVFAHYMEWCDMSGYGRQTLSSNKFYDALDGEKIKQKRNGKLGWVIECNFELPGVDTYSQHILGTKRNREQMAVSVDMEDTPLLGENIDHDFE